MLASISFSIAVMRALTDYTFRGELTDDQRGGGFTGHGDGLGAGGG